MDTTPDEPAEDTFEDLPEDILSLNTDEILTRIRLLDNDIKVRLLPCRSLKLRPYALQRLCVQKQ